MKKKKISKNIFLIIFLMIVLLIDAKSVDAKAETINKEILITSGNSRSEKIYEKRGWYESAPTFGCDFGSEASTYLEVKLINGDDDFGRILVKKVPSEKKVFKFTCESESHAFSFSPVTYNITLTLNSNSTVDKKASTYSSSQNNNQNGNGSGQNGNNSSQNGGTNSPDRDETGGTPEEKCDGIFGSVDDKNSLAYMLNKILKFMQFLGPVLVIGISIMELVRAVASSDKDAMTKFLKKLVKRLIYAVLLFVFPAILDLVLGWINVYGTCGIGG